LSNLIPNEQIIIQIKYAYFGSKIQRQPYNYVKRTNQMINTHEHLFANNVQKMPPHFIVHFIELSLKCAIEKYVEKT
jgi:hypothetical protein